MFTRLRFNSKEQVPDRKANKQHSSADHNETILRNSSSTRANSGMCSLPVISSTSCTPSVVVQSGKNSSQPSNTMTIQSTSNQTDERKSKLQSKSSIRLINGSIGTLRNNRTDQFSSMRTEHGPNSLTNNPMNNPMTNDDNQDANSLLYKRMLSYSTHSLEPNVKQAAQENSALMNQQTVNNYRTLNTASRMTNTMEQNKSSLRTKNEQQNEMMRLLGRHSTDGCSEKCCEIKSNDKAPKLPKIKLNRDLKMMQASLNNYKATNMLRKSSSMFSKSLDSLANLHLYETLESMNTDRLQHRISRKRTLNTIFPQINLRSKTDACLDESNEALSNDLDDLDNDVDLNDFDIEDDELLNDDFNDDEIELFKFSINAEQLHLADYNLPSDLHSDQRQNTTKIVLKKQPKIRQRQQPAKLMKDSVVKSRFDLSNEQNGFLIKKNSFLSNYYGSESDESPR